MFESAEEYTRLRSVHGIGRPDNSKRDPKKLWQNASRPPLPQAAQPKTQGMKTSTLKTVNRFFLSKIKEKGGHSPLVNLFQFVFLSALKP